MDEEEEQGPRASYSGERRWGVAQWKWRRHGHNLLSVHAVGIKSGMACSLRKRAEEGNKGEQRGFARSMREACGRPCPQKEKEGGVRYGDEGEDQERTIG